jgi:2-phospho-L-lactate/phosphoenolpyruvate guanylyltransferase
MSRLHPTGSSWQHRKIMTSHDQGAERPAIEEPVERRCVALVALKSSDVAKSRLTTVPGPLRRRLAWTMALDTMRALTAVLPVIVISNQPELAARLSSEQIFVRVLVEPVVAGMNAALRHGEKAAAVAGFSSTLACVGDLPALRPDSIRAVLAAAINGGRAFVADASGTGTTMLIASGTELDPHFQGRSAAGHRASGAFALGAAELGGPLADARRDVDSEVDLYDAYFLGLGSSTAQLFDARGRLGRYELIMVDDARPGEARYAMTTGGDRVRMAAGAWSGGPAAGGQRLHAVISKSQVLSAWPE